MNGKMADRPQTLILDVAKLAAHNFNLAYLETALQHITELTLYPGSQNIEQSNLPAYAEFRDKFDRMVLKVEHDPESDSQNSDSDHKYHQNPVHKIGFLPPSSNSINFHFSDIFDRVLFTASGRSEIVKVNVGSLTIGAVDGRALDLLSIPSITITDMMGKVLAEIPVNDKNSLKATKVMNQFRVYSYLSDREIGKLGRNLSSSGSRFGVAFPKDGVDPAAKAMIIVAAFLTFGSLFANSQAAPDKKEDRSHSHLWQTYWKQIAVAVLVIFLVAVVGIAVLIFT